MEILKTVFVFIHLLGLAALIGGGFAQWNASAKLASPTMLWGARVQLISGLVLWGLVASTEQGVYHAKFAVKLVANAVIVGILESSRRSLSNTGFLGSMGLSIFNVALALFWATSAEG
jgi:hypothetical protein